MIVFDYFKAEPNEYVLVFKNGQVVRHGPGLAFWYFRPTTSIALVPTTTVDALFALNETTADYQSVNVQGQITYRVADPQKVATLLNFIVEPRSRAYRSEDPAKLSQRIVNAVQMQMRAELQGQRLEQALRAADALARTVISRVQSDPLLASVGIECQSLFVTAIKPTPEIAKALEAEQRELLQRRADQAIYARRAEAVEQERRIKQNELGTQVDLEQRRAELVALQGENLRKTAEVDAEATRVRVAPFAALEPRMVLALALRELAMNAARIGSLNVAPELLATLLEPAGRSSGGATQSTAT